MLLYHKKWKHRNKEQSDPQDFSLEDGRYEDASDKNNDDIPEPSGNDIANAVKGDIIENPYYGDIEGVDIEQI